MNGERTQMYDLGGGSLAKIGRPILIWDFSHLKKNLKSFDKIFSLRNESTTQMNQRSGSL